MSENLKNKQILPECFEAPLFVHWYLTLACNLRCVHCYNNSGELLQNELTRREAIALANELSEMKVFSVCFSGGEPLLRKDLFDIAHHLSSRGILVHMITNGWYVTKNVAEKIKNAGISQVQVSIDGATPGTHDRIRGKPGSFKRAIRAAKYIVEQGILLSIAAVPTKINFEEFSRMINLAASLGARRFITQQLALTGKAAINRSFLELSEKEYDGLIKIISLKQAELQDYMLIQMGDPLAHLHCFQRLPNLFCEISSNGNVRVSPYLPFTCGNVREKSMKTLWRHATYAYRHPEVLKYVDQVNSMSDLTNLTTAWLVEDKELDINNIKEGK